MGLLVLAVRRAGRQGQRARAVERVQQSTHTRGARLRHRVGAATGGGAETEDGRNDLIRARSDEKGGHDDDDAKAEAPARQASPAHPRQFAELAEFALVTHGSVHRRPELQCQCARHRKVKTDRSLDGRVAVITGGGKGIGRAIALELAARGARVVVTGRDEAALGEAVGEIAHGGGQARHVAGDVRDDTHLRAAVARAVETWGTIDIAVANAGISPSTPLARTGAKGTSSVATARAIIETNLLGAYGLFDAALSAMGGPGRLIAVSSVLGKFGVAGQSAYCASKAGLHGLVRAIALEVGPRGVTCNAVCPGWVETAMAQARLEEMAHRSGSPVDETREAARQALPLGRFVEPEEVARFVAFLCSKDADAITGQALSICAGSTPFAG